MKEWRDLKKMAHVGAACQHAFQTFLQFLLRPAAVRRFSASWAEIPVTRIRTSSSESGSGDSEGSVGRLRRSLPSQQRAGQGKQNREQHHHLVGNDTYGKG